jgi:hypothetical protein
MAMRDPCHAQRIAPHTPLEATAKAQAHVDTGRKKGNVILTVAGA